MGLSEACYFSDLGNLKRHPSFQRDYDEWTKETIEHEGPMGENLSLHLSICITLTSSVIVNILLRRLGWDNASARTNDTDLSGPTKLEYFTANIRDELVRVIVNDWPYSGLYSSCLATIIDPSTTVSSAPGRHSFHHMVSSTIRT